MRRAPPFRFYQITDRRIVGAASLPDVLERLCGAGLRGLQVREKDLDDERFLALLQAILSKIPAGVAVLVNGRIDAAIERGLGVHRPESGPPTSEIRRRIGPDALIGVSCHDLAGCLKAREEGADFVTLGPVFESPGKGASMGLNRFAAVAAEVDLPVFALGGVTAERTAACLAAGAYGVAAISATLGAVRPEDVFEAFHRVLGDAAA